MSLVPFPGIEPTTPVLGQKVAAEAISGPGCYVCDWNGHILRVLGDGNGYLPVVSIVGEAPLCVTKISDNPFLPLRQARALAESICPAASASPPPPPAPPPAGAPASGGTAKQPASSTRAATRKKSVARGGRKLAAKRATISRKARGKRSR